MIYADLTADKLNGLKARLQAELDGFKKQNLALDMSRGKPSTAQLDLSMPMLEQKLNFKPDKVDYRNYGLPEGIPEARRLFAELLEVDFDEVIVLDGSSLNIMFDTVARAMLFGTYEGATPWSKCKTKFICCVPGYDRHFGICEVFGIEMISVDMTLNGPDMDKVEKLVSEDESIKGIWCVPKFSNPDGTTYSDDTVRRFAALKPKAKDFRIFWDNAYCVHELYDGEVALLNIFDECKKLGSEDMVYEFASTSKITFSGAGISVFVTSKANIAYAKKIMFYQTIGPNKVNQYMHYSYLPTVEKLRAHMREEAAIIRPKFEALIGALTPLRKEGLVAFTEPKGGYFVSIMVQKGCAKRVVELAKEAGVKLTGAGATYPYGKDPNDSNIRLAPTLPPVDEIAKVADILAICIRLASVEKQLSLIEA